MKSNIIEENKEYTKEEIKIFKEEAKNLLKFENNNFLEVINNFKTSLIPLFDNNKIKNKELLEEMSSVININLYKKIEININNFNEKIIIKQYKNEIFHNINYIIENINKFKLLVKDFFYLNEEEINDEFFEFFDNIIILLLSIYHLNKMLYDNI